MEEAVRRLAAAVGEVEGQQPEGALSTQLIVMAVPSGPRACS